MGPALVRLRVHWPNIVPCMEIHWANFPGLSGKAGKVWLFVIHLGVALGCLNGDVSAGKEVT